MLVGNSLFDYYLQENERIVIKKDQDDDPEALTLVERSELDKASATASPGSTDEKASPHSTDSKLRHALFRTSRPVPPKSASDNKKTGSIHTVRMSSRASISDFRRSESAPEELDDDDTRLVNALRPPASSEGAEIIDASAFLRDKSDSNVGDENEVGSESSTGEIREEEVMPDNVDNSDSHGPPSNYKG